MAVGGPKLERIRLYDALTFLTAPQGKALLDSVGRDTYELARLREYDPFEFHEKDKIDPFQNQVLEHVFDEHFDVKRSKAIPVAIIRALAKAADAGGTIELDKIEQNLGPYAAKVAQAISRGLLHFAGPPLPINTKYETADEALRRLIAASMPGNWGRERMPLLGDITERLGSPTTFEGWKMATMSHLFATRPALYDELENCGLYRGDHIVNSKAYSKNADVGMALEADGWVIDPKLDHHPLPKELEDATPEDRQSYRVLREMFAGVDPTKEDKPRFLLLDDGAHLLVALHKYFPEYAKLCVAVEQTDHGIQRIERELGGKLGCPVVNMARSWLKKELESPMIGEAVVHSVELCLNELHPELDLDPKRDEVALIGFGAVDQAVAQSLLRRGFGSTPEDRKKIWVWDPDPDAQRAAAELGFSVAKSRDEALRHGRLTISATGRMTVEPNEYDRLPADAILVNAGSGQHELGMDRIGVDQDAVADLAGGRRYTRVTARPDQVSGRQIETFVTTALDQLALREGLLGQKLPRTVSILGYDSEAKRAVEMLIAAGFPKSGIRVADADPNALREAMKDGLQIAPAEKVIPHGTIVLGNEANSIGNKPEMAKIAPNAIYIHHAPLVYPHGADETAYAARGAQTSHARNRLLEEGHRVFRGLEVDDASRRAGHGFRHRVLTTGSGNELLVLRSGYVVNMEVGVPPEYAQLILGMLQTACIQATSLREARLHELAHQDDLKKWAQARLAEQGLPGLERPDFSRLLPAIVPEAAILAP